jgi:hypothetical protein
MAGLLLGFVVQAWHQSPDELIVGGTPAGIRSLIWFPAFALFLSVRWTGPSRTLALTAGVVVLLLNLCISDGISIPAVAIPLWVVIALVVVPWEADVSHSQRPIRQGGQFAFLGRILPIPVCAALVMVYWGLFLHPTAQGAGLARHALKASEDFRRAVYAPPRGGQLVRETQVGDVRRDPAGFVRRHILRPLQAASEANPEDVRYLRSLAFWTGEVWRMTRRDADRAAALEYVHKAQAEDPLNVENFLTEAHLEVMASQVLQLQAWNPTLAVSTPWGPFFTLQVPIQPLGLLVRTRNAPAQTAAGKAAHLASENAAKALADAVQLSPTQARLHFQLMTGLQVAGHIKDAEREARRTLELDRNAHRSRKLAPLQREQIQRWLDSRPAK